MSKSALIIIDTLNDFLDEEGALYVGETVKVIIPEIQKRIARAREDKEPVIYVCDNHAKDDKEFETFPPHCVEGTRGAEVHKDLRPNPDDAVVLKTRYSGFFRTGLEDLLEKLDVDTVELVGVCTHICVLYTCADARNRDISVVVDRHCVDSFDRAAHSAALKEMDRTLGAKVV